MKKLFYSLILITTIYVLLHVPPEIEAKEQEYGILVQLKDDYNVNDRFLLKQGTLLYAKVENNEVVNVNILEQDIAIPKSIINFEVDEIENIPPYLGIEDQEYKLRKVDQLYGYPNGEVFVENIQIAIPIYTQQDGIEVAIIGNTPFFIEQEDFYDLMDKENANENEEASGNEEESEDTARFENEPGEELIETEETSVDKQIHEKDVSNQTKTLHSDHSNKKSMSVASSQQTWGSGSGYFRVVEDGAVVYDIRSGRYEPVGELVKGQVYHRVGESGRYHKIQFGDFYGYVHMSRTEWSDGKEINNLNTKYKNTSRTFVAKDDIRVIDNSSGSFVTMGYIKKGTRFAIAENSGTNFWRVIYGGRVGFVYKNQVMVDFQKTDNYFKVIEEGAVVYDIRSGKYVPVGELEVGEEYIRQGESGRYHKIQFGDFYGYVHMSRTEPSDGKSIKNKNTRYSNIGRTFTAQEDIRVIDNSSGKFVTMGYIKKGAEFAIAENSGTDYWRVIYANRVGYVKKDQTRTSFKDSDKYFQAINNAPIYDIRTGKYVKVGEVSKGEYFPRLGKSGNYHKIKFGDYYGYIHFSNTVVGIGNNIKNEWTNEKNSQKSIIVEENVNVIDNSTGKFVTMGILEKGAELKILSESSNYVKIIFANRIGYVKKDKVNIISPKRIKIFIDPGHGGEDPGARNGKTYEKDLNLDIAKRIVKYLNQYSGIEIKMSRTTDTTVSLSQRTKAANDWGADYFVSIHINAGGGTGFESYIYEQKDKNGRIIGSPTQDEIKKQAIIHDHIATNIKSDGVRDRGKKRADFHVLRESNMSAILFEYLFIDNPNDLKKLQSESFRDKLARLTAEGIAKAFNLTKK